MLNSVKRRMTFENAKSLSSVTVIFNLCMMPPMSKGSATATSRPKRRRRKEKTCLREQRKTFRFYKRGTRERDLIQKLFWSLGNKPRTTKYLLSFYSSIYYSVSEKLKHQQLVFMQVTQSAVSPLVSFLMSLNLSFLIFKMRAVGFPGGAVVESLPADAGDTGSSPGLGGSHMPRSDWARGPQLLSLCSTTREAAMKSGPHLPQIEKALAQKRRPNTAVNK